MGKYTHVDPFRFPDEPVQGTTQKAVPPVFPAGMADEDLRNAVRAREIHESFYRIVPIEGGGLGSYFCGLT